MRSQDADAELRKNALDFFDLRSIRFEWHPLAFEQVERRTKSAVRNLRKYNCREENLSGAGCRESALLAGGE